jgi:hypothetical protein
MKNWPTILERAIEDVNEAFGVNVTEYGRYLVKGSGQPPIVTWMLSMSVPIKR